jgi:hypothetical protein
VSQHFAPQAIATKTLTRRASCLQLHQASSNPTHVSITTIFFPSNAPSKRIKMDTLVARYSQPLFEQEYSQDDQMELYQPTPSLSLKFAMPPVAQVSCFYSTLDLSFILKGPSNHMLITLCIPAVSLAPRSNG